MNQLERTARIIFDAMEGGDWEALSKGEKKEWLAKAQEMLDAIGAEYWPKHRNAGTIQ